MRIEEDDRVAGTQQAERGRKSRRAGTYDRYALASRRGLARLQPRRGGGPMIGGEPMEITDRKRFVDLTLTAPLFAQARTDASQGSGQDEIIQD
jgi:hypothetical protein